MHLQHKIEDRLAKTQQNKMLQKVKIMKAIVNMFAEKYSNEGRIRSTFTINIKLVQLQRQSRMSCDRGRSHAEQLEEKLHAATVGVDILRKIWSCS